MMAHGQGGRVRGRAPVRCRRAPGRGAWRGGRRCHARAGPVPAGVPACSGGAAVNPAERAGRLRRVPGWVVGLALGVLFLVSVAGFLGGVFFWWASSGVVGGARVPPRQLWEAQVYLAGGFAALLAFPLALWLVTRVRAALVLLLAMAILSAAFLTLSVLATLNS